MDLSPTPFPALAPEGTNVPVLSGDELTTLTLATPARGQPADGLASANAKCGMVRSSGAWPLRAAILPSPGEGLTLTL